MCKRTGSYDIKDFELSFLFCLVFNLIISPVKHHAIISLMFSGSSEASLKQKILYHIFLLLLLLQYEIFLLLQYSIVFLKRCYVLLMFLFPFLKSEVYFVWNGTVAWKCYNSNSIKRQTTISEFCAIMLSIALGMKSKLVETLRKTSGPVIELQKLWWLQDRSKARFVGSGYLLYWGYSWGTHGQAFSHTSLGPFLIN